MIPENQVSDRILQYVGDYQSYWGLHNRPLLWRISQNMDLLQSSQTSPASSARLLAACVDRAYRCVQLKGTSKPKKMIQSSLSLSLSLLMEEEESDSRLTMLTRFGVNSTMNSKILISMTCYGLIKVSHPPYPDCGMLTASSMKPAVLTQWNSLSCTNITELSKLYVSTLC